MKRLFSALLLTSSIALAQSTKPATRPAEPWKNIPVPKLHDFHPVAPRRIELPNGTLIFLAEDHELPFISGFVRVRGGARDVPADKVGLIGMYGSAWRTSGTKELSGDKLDDLLALKAASIETSGDTASTSLSWSSFASDFDATFTQALDLLLHPEFRADKLELARRNSLSNILRRDDDPASLAGRKALEIAYGKDNPYGRSSQVATVKAVTLDDLKQWHATHVCGANLIVAVIGDFNAAEMEAKLREAFGAIPQGTRFDSHLPEFHDPTPGVYFIQRGDVNQSNILMVGLGTRQDNPDFYALTVMNEVFSGGFASRVVQNVRTKLGLAYEVGGNFGAAYDHPGLFVAEAATKSESSVPASKAVLAEIARLRTSPPTEAELRRAKDDLLNSFIFRYDSPEKVLGEQITLAVYGYPADFLERYRAGIERVTAADVARVAQQYVRPEKLAIVVVGDPAKIVPPLDKLGPVTKLDK